MRRTKVSKSAKQMLRRYNNDDKEKITEKAVYIRASIKDYRREVDEKDIEVAIDELHKVGDLIPFDGTGNQVDYTGVSVDAELMNAVPYGTFAAMGDNKGGNVFSYVSGERTVRTYGETSVNVALQFAVKSPIQARYLWCKIVVEHEHSLFAPNGTIVNTLTHTLSRTSLVSIHGWVNIWGWLQQVPFKATHPGLYRLLLYLEASPKNSFSICHGKTLVFIGGPL